MPQTRNDTHFAELGFAGFCSQVVVVRSSPAAGLLECGGHRAAGQMPDRGGSAAQYRSQTGTQQSHRAFPSFLQVVPFSPAAGLLEWVEDTVPLGRYLIGEDRMSGAHRRYARPGELSFFESYTAMDKGQREGRPRQAFDKVAGWPAMLPEECISDASICCGKRRVVWAPCLPTWLCLGCRV